LALDIILHQQLLRDAGNSENPVHCIYVAIGATKAKLQEYVALLQAHGAMQHTTVVAATDKDPTLLQERGLSSIVSIARGCHFTRFFNYST
jgi:F-type H+-transporting ATPase subunit alpha